MNYEEKIEKIIEMGFKNRNKIERALRETNGDIDQAIERYLL